MTHLFLKASLIILFLFSSATTFSQYYYYNNKYYDSDLIWEVGTSFGTMHAYTDVGRRNWTPVVHKNFDLKSAKTNRTLYVGFLYQNLMGLRLEFTSGSIAAADSNAAYKFRNTNFRSDIKELTLVGELHPLMFKFWNNLPRLSPYLTAGIGVFAFNPQTYYNGQWIDLKPLSTEGQGFAEYPDRKHYSLISVSVPVGIGLKYEICRLVSMRLETLVRNTLTDYLDDASETSIDPNLYSNYFPKQKAALAAALTNRSKEVDPESNHEIIYKGGGRTKDKFVTVNLKVGITLGRQRIR
jgi:hypothetical protein